MEQHFHMVGGEHKTSYAKNSWLPWVIQEKVKPTLDECIGELVKDMRDLQSGVAVVDLGCSSGPNAFFTAQNIVQYLRKHSRSYINNCKNLRDMPTIQYFMNDLVSNDFNLVFRRLPEFYEKMAKEIGEKRGSCIIGAVAGTFYDKLFPNCSIQFFHSCYALHWLSQVPKGLMTKTCVSLNKWDIHCARKSPQVVQKAYKDQFRHDFNIFLRMRSRELVQQGQLFLIFLCENSEEDDDHDYLQIMGSVLRDMVKEGCIKEEKLDNFNIPIHFTSVRETKEIVESEGSFQILKFYNFKTPLDAGYEFSDFLLNNNGSMLSRARYVATYQRAVFGPIFASHFEESIMDDFFHRYTDKLVVFLRNGKGLHNTMVISLKKMGC